MCRPSQQSILSSVRPEEGRGGRTKTGIGSRLCEKGAGFSMNRPFPFVTASPSRQQLSPHLRARLHPRPRVYPLERGVQEASPLWGAVPSSLGLGFPGDQALGPCRLPLSALGGSVLVTEKPNLLGSALRPLLPSPTPFQGLRDLFYLQSLKKPVAKVTGAGTAGSLPWGRGFAPKQLSVGAVPAGTSAFACSGRKQPRENTFPSAPLPPRPLHRKSPLVPFPGGSQPASSEMLQ